ncbi:hypothetical protein L6164_035328 [Bauhinia variegata]|uniref:Uncharacterized protein n=1 Tax=Bauhinia variegata TaxID=167791 RepID=A0ACB9KDM6_BAUVA|nr:hypothetical protein L6164_035328 [Bauhinia variegata]
MKSLEIGTHPLHLYASFNAFTHPLPPVKKIDFSLNRPIFQRFPFLNSQSKSSRSIISCSSRSAQFSNSGSDGRGSEAVDGASDETILDNENFQSLVGSPKIPSFAFPVANLSLNDQAFFLLTLIACTTSVAFTSLVVAAVPTLFAMRNAAISLSKLADTTREELPSTMAAIRLSGMEISDLTLELSDLSQEISDGVSKSAQALQAAEAGIRQIGSLAQQQTICMIEERANLPVISLQPVVAGAAKKTSRAVGRATKTLMNIISGREGAASEEDRR